ncbi:reverse transcriptase domain-containing protein [Tanacetum coccineum]
MSKYGVTHRLSTPYTSQTSVKVEVHNRGLKNLERTVGENRASWSNKLDNALWAFKTAYKTPIRCTPYKLVYGKACHLPVSDRVKADGRRSYKEKEHNIEPSAAGEWVAWGILCTSLQSVIRDMGDSTTVVAYLGVWGRERASASLRPAVLGQYVQPTQSERRSRTACQDLDCYLRGEDVVAQEWDTDVRRWRAYRSRDEGRREIVKQEDGISNLT